MFDNQNNDEDENRFVEMLCQLLNDLIKETDGEKNMFDPETAKEKFNEIVDNIVKTVQSSSDGVDEKTDEIKKTIRRKCQKVSPAIKMKYLDKIKEMVARLNRKSVLDNIVSIVNKSVADEDKIESDDLDWLDIATLASLLVTLIWLSILSKAFRNIIGVLIGMTFVYGMFNLFTDDNLDEINREQEFKVNEARKRRKAQRQNMKNRMYKPRDREDNQDE